MCLPGSSMAPRGLLSLSLLAMWEPVSWQQCVLGDSAEAMGRDPSCCLLGFLTLGPQLRGGGGATLWNGSW